MAPHLYPLWKKALLDQGPTTNNDSGITDSATLGPFVVLIDTAFYTWAPTHQFVNPAITTATIPTVGPAGGVRITPTTTTAGSTGTDDTCIFNSSGVVTFTSISGPSVEALIIYRLNAGANTTWRLMSYYDTAGGGLPVTPNSGNITITWNAGGIFSISDAAAKHDIQRIGDYGPFGLYAFRYRAPESPRYLGFIAQEVEKLAPWAVRRHGGYKHVNYAEALAYAKR